MASKFSARCARRLFLKKNIVKQGKNNWRIQFLRDMTTSEPENLVHIYEKANITTSGPENLIRVYIRQLHIGV